MKSLQQMEVRLVETPLAAEAPLVETPLAAEAPLEVTPLVARPAETPLEEVPAEIPLTPLTPLEEVPVEIPLTPLEEVPTPLAAKPAEIPLEEVPTPLTARPERLVMKAPGMMAPGMIIQETGLVARTDPGLTTTATIAQTSGRTLGLKEIGPTQTVSELTKPAAISVVVTGLPGMTLMDPALM